MSRTRNWLISCCLAALAILVVGCSSDETSVSQGEAVISGVITDGFTAQPLADVAVSGQRTTGDIQAATSDAQGNFKLTFTMDSTGSATVSLKKTGYRDTSFVVLLRSGTVTVVSIAMNPKSLVVPPGGGTGSGLAQTIAFLGADPTEVSVYGVGGKETAILAWEVRDSIGLPVDQQHAVTLAFSSVNGPGGGEYVAPPTQTTNANGRAYTAFNSGTKSGVVQIVASATVQGRVITSSPVRLVINGGFPVQDHFSIAPTIHNFPALDWLGKTNIITVLAGDKYSNPVAKGTAIYFRATAGVVQPTAFSGDNGFGEATLYSGNPRPLGSYAVTAFGEGYMYVVARTLGQNGDPVQDSTLILWSGIGQIDNVSPSTPFDIPNTGSATYSFRVSDALGHPLAEGTRISVNAVIPPPPAQGVQQNQVTISFGNNGTVELPDLLFAGAGSTQFSFTIRDGSYDITTVTPVDVTISVTGPNVGNAISRTISGIVR